MSGQNCRLEAGLSETRSHKLGVCMCALLPACPHTPELCYANPGFWHHARSGVVIACHKRPDDQLRIKTFFHLYLPTNLIARTLYDVRERKYSAMSDTTLGELPACAPNQVGDP